MDIDGFRKIKLKLINTTPTGETMGPGVVVAVAKYHRNTCYTQTLSGEYGTPGNDWWKCRNAEEEISVSAPWLIPELSRDPNAPQPLTFDFSARPIPINATDLYLQVVYRGKLGAEDDAMVVATKDVFEPTFLAYANCTDYVEQDGHYYPYDDPFSFSLSFGFGPVFVADIDNLPPARYSRVAFITDQDSITVSDDSGFDPEEFTPQVNQFYLADNMYYGSPLISFRGTNQFDAIFFVMDQGTSAIEPPDSEMINPLDTAPYPVTINF